MVPGTQRKHVNFENLNNLLLTPWHYIIEETLIALIELMPDWLRTVLWAHKRPTSNYIVCLFFKEVMAYNPLRVI